MNEVYNYNMKIKLYQTQLKKKITEIENKFYSIIDTLEQTLGSYNVKSEVVFKNMEIIRHWSQGKIEASRVSSVLSKAKFDDIAYAVLLKQLDKLLYDNPDHEDIILNASKGIAKEVYPLYIAYLKLFHTFIIFVATIDADMAPVFWTYESTDKKLFYYNEFSVNRLIKFLLYTKVDKYNGVSYENYVLKFKKDGEIHTVFTPNNDIHNLLKKVFKITTSHFNSKEKYDSLKQLDRKIYAKNL